MFRRNSLAWIIKDLGHLPVMPLMGFPGVNLNGSTLKQNTFNWGVQFWTVYELARRFQPDGIFTLMDLSVEASALGLPVVFPLNESPSVEYPVIRSVADLQNFSHLDVLRDGRVNVFVETMRLMSDHLSTLRGGYVIGPYTLAGLMLGASEAALATLDDPALVHATLELASHVIGRYANALAKAGADVIAVLEPSAMMLSPRLFREFSARYVQQVFAAFEAIPVLHICGDTTHLVGEMVATGAQGLSLDSVVDLPMLAQRVPSDVVLIGNVSPTSTMTYSAPETVYAETRALVESMALFPNFILSTGCDLPQETPLDNIKAFMDAGRGRPLDVTGDGHEPLVVARRSPRDGGDEALALIRRGWGPR